jgi:hypothetical protein
MLLHAKIGTSPAMARERRRAMKQPLGNCPGCGGDEPFEQIHAGDCPDTGGECPEWACTACGAAVIMGTLPDAAPVTYRSARAA